jgi:hypothetical protein
MRKQRPLVQAATMLSTAKIPINHLVRELSAICRETPNMVAAPIPSKSQAQPVKSRGLKSRDKHIPLGTDAAMDSNEVSMSMAVNWSIMSSLKRVKKKLVNETVDQRTHWVVWPGIRRSLGQENPRRQILLREKRVGRAPL